MDHAVALVEAYLRVDGYLTVAEQYPMRPRRCTMPASADNAPTRIFISVDLPDPFSVFRPIHRSSSVIPTDPRWERAHVAEHLVHRTTGCWRDLFATGRRPSDLDDDLRTGDVAQQLVLQQQASAVDLDRLAQRNHRHARRSAVNEHGAQRFAGPQSRSGVVGGRADREQCRLGLRRPGVVGEGSGRKPGRWSCRNRVDATDP